MNKRLIETFPAVPITRAGLHDDEVARWAAYDDRDDLARLEGKTWRELDAELIERHATLLTYADDRTYRATLPAYLTYLLEHAAYNEVPFHVAGQLWRKGEDDPRGRAVFDRRIAPLTTEQRAVIRSAIGELATREPMQEVMTRALLSWDELTTTATS